MSRVVVGRERELVEAGGFVAKAAQTSCGLLLVGEPGIGKTTIWSGVVDDAASRGYAVLVARPSEAETEHAFGALIDLFAPLDETQLAELPAAQRHALEGALRRRESATAVDPTSVAAGVLGVLGACSTASPVVVAVDDLQWVDTPSRRALSFAFRRLDGSPVGFLATVRTGFEDELTQIAARDPDRVARVDIEGLGERDLARLILERTGRSLTPAQLRRLEQLSGGNPYYALELVATGDPELHVPESLAATLRARLSNLSGSARVTGLTAATVGRFHGSVRGAAVDELRAAGIIEIRSGALWFSHPLLASTLLEMHTIEERRAVHLSVAAALDDPDERALHLARGTVDKGETVARELESAARRLKARGAPETAATLAERAAELTPDEDAAAATRRLLSAADLYQAAGEGCVHVLPLLGRLVETLPSGPDRARVLIRLGWLGAQMDTMSGSEAARYQQRALAEAGDTADVVRAANAVLARMLGNGGDFRAALLHAERAVAAGGVNEANLMFPSPSGELGTARFLTGEGFDETLFEQGIAMESTLERVGEPYQSSKLQLALAWLFTGQLSRARTALHHLLELSVELGRVGSTAGCVLHLVELEVRAGNLAQAEAHAAEFVHLDRQLRGDLSGEWYPSGLVAVHLGRVEDARRILGGGIEYCRSVESMIWLAHQLRALGHLELALGSLDAAREALVPLTAMLRDTGLGEWAVHPVHPDAIETLVELGEIEEASSLQAELEEYGLRLDRPWGLACAARSAALIASAHGAHEEALEATRRALEHHERLDWPFERARTLLVRGGILRRLGRRREAATALTQAKSTFAALRNPLWHARVDAEEQRLGGRRRTTSALTPTEARVAELAGHGLRNAEIALRFHVTPKTVEATLSRVYRKLGVRSRTELARRLPERTAGPAWPEAPLGSEQSETRVRPEVPALRDAPLGDALPRE